MSGAARPGVPPDPTLHLPAEPAAKADWRAAVLDGEDLVAVMSRPDGIVDWLWSRWRTLEVAGMDRKALEAVAVSYRREIWLWLSGDRTWEQCCSGLIGRIERRLPWR